MEVQPLIFIQLNDLYLHDAKSDYSRQDTLLLPRIATIISRLRAKFGNRVRFCLPGDFLAPSCLSLDFRGRHMVDVLNCMGLDYVTLGNHEFEFEPQDLITAITDSQFMWLTTNFDKGLCNELEIFEHANWQTHTSITLSDRLIVVLVGLLGRGIYQGFGEADDPIERTNEMLRVLREELDKNHKSRNAEWIVVAMTHQDLSDDIRLATECQYPMTLIMGGHDHDVLEYKRENDAIIVKSLSNARTVRVTCLVGVKEETNGNPTRDLYRIWQGMRHELVRTINEDSRIPIVGKEATINSLRKCGPYYVGAFSLAIDTTSPEFISGIPEEPTLTKKIHHWNARWKQINPDADRQLWTIPHNLDAEERLLRKQSTNFGNLVGDILRWKVRPPNGPHEEAIAVINSGALRINRRLNSGEIVTLRTVKEIFFFFNEIQLYSIKGEMVELLIQKSVDLLPRDLTEGCGDFLQIAGFSVRIRDNKAQSVLLGKNKTALRADSMYNLVCTDYVATCTHYKECFVGARAQLIGPVRETFREWLSIAKPRTLLSDISAERWIFE